MRSIGLTVIGKWRGERERNSVTENKNFNQKFNSVKAFLRPQNTDLPERVFANWAVDVTQLVERLLPTPHVRRFNPVIGIFFI